MMLYFSLLAVGTVVGAAILLPLTYLLAKFLGGQPVSSVRAPQAGIKKYVPSPVFGAASMTERVVYGHTTIMTMSPHVLPSFNVSRPVAQRVAA
jgi:hypothetical protein